MERDVDEGRERGFVSAQVRLGPWGSSVGVKHLFTLQKKVFYYLYFVGFFPVKYIFVNLRDYHAFSILIGKKCYSEL